MLRERELYVEECENTLVEQSMILTEREAQVEQSEEDFAVQIKSIHSSSATTETDSSKAS